jgi:hypothetical protein
MRAREIHPWDSFYLPPYLWSEYEVAKAGICDCGVRNIQFPKKKMSGNYMRNLLPRDCPGTGAHVLWVI